MLRYYYFFPDGGDQVMGRSHWFAIHLMMYFVSMALWIILSVLLIYVIMNRLCRKRRCLSQCHSRRGCSQGQCESRQEQCHRHHGHHQCGEEQCQCGSHQCGDHRHRCQCRDHHQCGEEQCQCGSHHHAAVPLLPIDAIEILRQRYASGEIDDTTFQHMRERLGSLVRSEQTPEA